MMYKKESVIALFFVHLPSNQLNTGAKFDGKVL